MKLVVTDGLISIVTFVYSICANNPYLRLSSVTWFVRISLLVVEIQVE